VLEAHREKTQGNRGRAEKSTEEEKQSEKQKQGSDNYSILSASDSWLVERSFRPVSSSGAP
jgi:hypothetical protein